MQKARSHSVRSLRIAHRAPTACRQTVSGTISLSSPEYFSPFPHGTCPLSVASLYLALEDGPPSFPQDFPCPVVLGNAFQEVRFIWPTGLSPSVAGLPRPFGYRLNWSLPEETAVPSNNAPQPPRYNACGLDIS